MSGSIYLVRVGGSVPEVVDAAGQSVTNAHVLRITFPYKSMSVLGKTTHYISGSGKAEIMVNGQEISEVSLC